MVATIIMLYGIPTNDPLLDPSYYNYFFWALFCLAKDDRIYVGGGSADPSRPELTESETAFKILTERLKVHPGRVKSVPVGLDARDVLEHLARELKGSSVRICCAYTHQDLVRFLAWKYFDGNVQVVPLTFPIELVNDRPRSRYLRIMRIPRTLLGIAGAYMPWARRLEQWLRERHMRKCAMYPNKLPPIT